MGRRTLMAEAKIQLPGGGRVDVSGTAEEVARIVGLVKQARLSFADESDRSRSSVRKPVKHGPRGRVLELKAAGFFNAKRLPIGAIRDGLASRGHIYPTTTLSGALLDLVQKGELERVKE